jgi:RHS repeat-associated protein
MHSMPTTAAPPRRPRSARPGTGSRRHRHRTRRTKSSHPRQVALARYYDPTIGRFTAVDPLADLSSPGTLDAYGYGRGSPVTLSDPTGLFTCPDVTCLNWGGGFLSGTPSSSSPSSEAQQAIDSMICGCDRSDPVENAARDAGWTPPQVKADHLRGLLELAGFIPLVGDAIDGALCGYSAGGGDGAGYDCAAMIPIFGSFGRGAKHADEGVGLLSRLLGRADDGLGTLRSVGDDVFESGAGLRYGPGSTQGHRLRHVMQHGAPDATGKASHSVFVGGRSQVLRTVDEAWLARGSGTVSSVGGREVYVVPMGRSVGTAGQRHVTIVVEKGTSNVITAHPSGPAG